MVHLIKYVFQLNFFFLLHKSDAGRHAIQYKCNSTMAVSCAPALSLAAPTRGGLFRRTRATTNNRTVARAPGRRRSDAMTCIKASASYTPTDRVSELQSEGAYAVLAAAQALERQGRDIVHLEIGQPGFPTPPHVVDAGVDAIQGGQTKCVALRTPPRYQSRIPFPLPPSPHPPRATWPAAPTPCPRRWTPPPAARCDTFRTAAVAPRGRPRP